MDLKNIDRLKDEQLRGLNETEEKLAQWEKFKSDYNALKERLGTLPDQVTHDVMVPFGPLAFMPGHLIHTNEILVLLGDNWFVERSAKQATDIVDRRVVDIDKHLEDLQSQHKLLESRLQFTSEMINPSREHEYFDITEEFDPEKEKAWREQHRKNVQRYRQKMKQEANKKEVTNEDLWARLDQLEIVEAERNEMEWSTDEESGMKSVDDMGKQKSHSTSHDRRVHWHDLDIKDTLSGDESDEEDSDDYEDEEEDDVDVHQGTQRITFTHTSVTNDKMRSPSDPEVQTDSFQNLTEKPVFSSPSDIYRLYNTKDKQKSVLKQSSNVTDSSKTRQKSERSADISIESSAVAFSGTVIEKQTSVSDRPIEHTEKESLKNTNPVDPPRRISRFKAQRQKIPDPT